MVIVLYMTCVNVTLCNDRSLHSHINKVLTVILYLDLII